MLFVLLAFLFVGHAQVAPGANYTMNICVDNKFDLFADGLLVCSSDNILVATLCNLGSQEPSRVLIHAVDYGGLVAGNYRGMKGSYMYNSRDIDQTWRCIVGYSDSYRDPGYDYSAWTFAKYVGDAVTAIMAKSRPPIRTQATWIWYQDYNVQNLTCVDIRCSARNGGCDPRVSCDAASTTNICGPCPAGYFGSGYTGCHACAEPQPGEYVQAACGANSNTVFEPCSEPEVGEYAKTACIAGSSLQKGADTQISSCARTSTGKYVVAACTQGSSRQAGKDTQISTCDAPTAGVYVQAVCGANSNTAFSTCSAPPPGQYVRTPCVPGSILQRGTDTQFSNCTQPAAGKYATAACAQGSSSQAGKDTQLTTCIEPIVGQYAKTTCISGSSLQQGTNTQISSCTQAVAGQYVVAACTQGSSSQAGKDAQISACTASKGGAYVQAVCGPNSDTVFATCSAPTVGQYVKTPCVTGSPLQQGADSQLSSCTSPAAGQYVTAVCTQGSSSQVGKDTQLTTCSAPSTTPAAGTRWTDYVTATCKQGSWNALGSNTQFGRCYFLDMGDYYAVDCVPGTWNQTGAPPVRSPCTAPQAGQYISKVCTERSNSQVTNCSQAGPGQYVKVACAPGFWLQLGADTKFASCTLPQAAQYVQAVCGANSDTVIANCSAPSTTPRTGERWTDYVTNTCKQGAWNVLGSNTQFGRCYFLDMGDYYAVDCVPGSWNQLGAPPVRTQCRAPQAGEYITKVCTERSNSEVSRCSEPGTGQYVIAVCDPGFWLKLGVNTKIASCSTPGSLQYAKTPCSPGNSTLAGTNTQLANKGFLTVFIPNYFPARAACVAATGTVKLETNFVPGVCWEPPWPGMVGWWWRVNCNPDGSWQIFQAKGEAICRSGSPPAETTLSIPGNPAACSADRFYDYLVRCDAGGCLAPTAGQYVKTPCTLGTSSTQFANCSAPGAGQYVKTPCVPGTANTMGTDTQFASCTAPASGQYVKTTCNQGAWNTVGSDTTFANCTKPGAGQGVQAACVQGAWNVVGKDTQLAGTGHLTVFIPNYFPARATCVAATGTVKLETDFVSDVCWEPPWPGMVGWWWRVKCNPDGSWQIFQAKGEALCRSGSPPAETTLSIPGNPAACSADRFYDYLARCNGTTGSLLSVGTNRKSKPVNNMGAKGE